MEETIGFEKETEPPSEDAEPPDSPGRPSASSGSVPVRVSHSASGSVFQRSAGAEAPKPRIVPHAKHFIMNPRADAFRRRFYPEVSASDWCNWHWQIHNRIESLRTLATMLRLSKDEYDALAVSAKALPLAITPYYASLLDENDPLQPVRRTVVPVMKERVRLESETEDPLSEEEDSPVPGIIHRYPDRILFLVTEFCSTYCRYCTRSRMVGGRMNRHSSTARWEKALAYVEQDSGIRDVLISGGDPLTLSNDRIEWLLSRLRRIPHVEFVRIGTKVPVVLPQRITHALTRMLKRYHPLWMSIHFTHPDELTPETNEACGRLADAGIPLGSQTVLLAGVNDQVETMKRLFHGLLKARVKPYYLYQCDPIPGSSHFRTPVEKGLEIIQGLRGHTTGYAVPSYVIDAPEGGGKIPLLPNYLAGRDGDQLLLRNYAGKTYCYPDPEGNLGSHLKY